VRRSTGSERIQIMSSWRDSASPQAQDDLDGLLGAVLPFAQQQLERRGEFFPFGARVTRDGEVVLLAGDPALGEQPASQSVLDVLYEGARAEAAASRAAAFVADVKVDGGDAIRAELEHAEGPSMTVLLPYSRSRLRKSVSYGAIRAGLGNPHIWATS
jgi:hypothetical protein